MNTKSDEPVIMIIASAKIHEWKDEVSLTNFPATRVYLNSSHHSVRSIRKSLQDGTFYKTEMEIEDGAGLPKFTVKEILSLKEDYIDKKVQCKLTVKKVDQKVKWFAEYCIACDVDLELSGNKFKCPNCGKMKPYPDKRYQLITLCSDESGTIPVMWSDDEVTRLTGKTVYDFLADDVQDGESAYFPLPLKAFEKISCTFTLILKKENVVEGSNVYNAESVELINDKADMVLETTLCEDKSEEKRIETSATHSPVKNTTLSVKATELTIVSFTLKQLYFERKTCTNHSFSQESNIHDKSPPTGKSSNKTRSRKTTETIDYDLEHAIPLGKRKSIKNEKYKN
ncbi:uncharacterized protein LOC135152556 isoform X1 [Daucus carota subsp. sativus]|uniref:uncharacterized protein LOC135146813 isoform X1 n=1 Tax=Daucus carota subsp. sativus TaxID=79200 RepID=UPI003083424F